MNTGKLSGVSLYAIGAAAPLHCEKNEKLTWISARERAALQAAVGVKERRIAQDVSLQQLLLVAAKGLLEDTNTHVNEISVLLLVTQTSPLRIPSLVFILQAELGLPANCVCLEVNWGCAGYVYGLWLARQLLCTAPEGKKALLLTGDISTRFLAGKDKSTVPLFSDAVSASLLLRNKAALPWYAYLASDASQHACIAMAPQTVGISTLHIDGMGIFQLVLRKVLPHLRQVLSHGPWKQDEVNCFIFHQASRIINEALRTRMGIPIEKCPGSLEKWGNTSSATIPITLLTALKQDSLTQPQKLLLCGFGTGFCWGTLLVASEQLHLSRIRTCTT